MYLKPYSTFLFYLLNYIDITLYYTYNDCVSLKILNKKFSFVKLFQEVLG